MGYKSMLAVGVALVAGYAIKSAIVPSTPAELSSALTMSLQQNPQAYERVIDQTREKMHVLKSEANPHKTLGGHVRFEDLRLELKEQPEGDLVNLVNKRTGEEQGVQYVVGRTSVGDYDARLAVVKYETSERGKQLVAFSPERTKTLGESIKAKATELYDSVGELFNSNGLEPKVEVPVEKKEVEKLEKSVETYQAVEEVPLDDATISDIQKKLESIQELEKRLMALKGLENEGSEPTSPSNSSKNYDQISNEKGFLEKLFGYGNEIKPNWFVENIGARIKIVFEDIPKYLAQGAGAIGRNVIKADKAVSDFNAEFFGITKQNQEEFREEI